MISAACSTLSISFLENFLLMMFELGGASLMQTGR